MTLLNASWLASLRDVTAPGESLKYDEAYVELKNNMSQVSFDVDTMIQVSSILLQRSYDWQLCQFLLLACAAGGYLDDFITTLEAYALILSQGDKCYPQTMKGRQATVFWLNQSAIVELLNQHKSSMTEEWLASCKTTWNILQGWWKVHFEAEHLSWHALGKWLDQKKPESVTIASALIVPSVQGTPLIQTIEDDRQACEQANKVWEYYWKAGNKLKAMCFSRTDVWSCVNIPQEQYGKTWLTPLRATDQQKLQQLFSEGEWEALWDFAEQCFMQPGGPFDVKLQYYIIQALENLHHTQALIWAKSFFLSWCQAYPALMDMHFNDGTPFCDEHTRGWVNSLSAPIESVIKMDDPFESTELAIRKKDKSANDWLSEFIPESYLDKIWQRYLWVLSDYVNQKSEHALRAYQALFKLSDDKELFLWEPNLMKKIWSLGLEISERLGVKYEQKNSTSMRDNILNHIIQHDVLFARNIMPQGVL